MKKILLSLFLAGAFCAPAFAAGEDTPTLGIITNVFATDVSVASGSVRSVRVGTNNSTPTIVLNAPGYSPVLLQNVAGAFSLTGSLGSAAFAGSLTQTPNTSLSAVETSTSISPVGISFAVINGTGTLTLESTPHIATTTALSGQSITLMGGANPVTFVDEGTLTGSLLELGANSRALGAGDILKLRYYGGKWYEEGFVNN